MALARKTGDLRAKIVGEATRLFAEKGYSGSSVRELADASECTKPALYYHFGSKEGLFEAVVAEHLQACSEAVSSIRTGKGTARERIHRTLDRFSDWILAHPDGMRLLLRLRSQAESEAPEVEIDKVHQLHMQLIAEAVDRGVKNGEIRSELDPLECALVIAGALHFKFEMFLKNDEWDRDILHRTVDMIFDGVSI